MSCFARYHYYVPMWAVEGREEAFKGAITAMQGTHFFHNFTVSPKRRQWVTPSDPLTPLPQPGAPEVCALVWVGGGAWLVVVGWWGVLG